ncbi:Protein STRUBBELIG-RECEPTOR FAMILY 7 [Camellia lanceoleosa]|uniref:Protein STRUBBELIG-RECEPTOR FAMILY 7 n=1 Tax=Camellia lanceoleosa TaxID=1840588 RepID=A0ACC0G7T3_9ERIC|nr:Protein STRUBBELIG-RECEPTOR FAMILY 7 [Camellia lanceoleosa]
MGRGFYSCCRKYKRQDLEASRTFSLQCSGLGLTGSMGYQLASLTAVTNFYISNNNLGNQIPYQLPPNCTQLNLAGNGFTGGIPYSIS